MYKNTQEQLNSFENSYPLCIYGFYIVITADNSIFEQFFRQILQMGCMSSIFDLFLTQTIYVSV